jgi:hypothetical protein
MISLPSSRIPWIASQVFAEQFEDLFEPYDLALGLAMMFFEGGAELIGVRRLGHFGQVFVDLFFSEVDVFQGVQKEIVQVLVCHVRLPEYVCF